MSPFTNLIQKLLNLSPYRERYLHKGSECWWIPGISPPGLLAIKCTVLEMSIDGRPLLDEPTVAPVHVEDVYKTREEAENVLWNLLSSTNNFKEGYRPINYPPSTLKSFRASMIAYFKKNFMFDLVQDLKDKVHKEEWFNFYDLQK